MENPTGALLPGAYGVIHFKLPNENLNYMLPVNTLIFRSEGLQIAIVRDDHVTLIPVTIGHDYGTQVEITSGLKGDESVVLNPPDSLTSGQQVRIADSSAAEGKGQPEGKSE